MISEGGPTTVTATNTTQLASTDNLYTVIGVVVVVLVVIGIGITIVFVIVLYYVK